MPLVPSSQGRPEVREQYKERKSQQKKKRTDPVNNAGNKINRK